MGKHPIIANGEYYVEPVVKRNFPGPSSFPHEYEEAKARLQKDIESIQELVHQSDELFIDEKIVCVRLEPKYEAKSYTPSSLLADTNMRLVGGRKYTKDLNSDKAKLYFMRASDEELDVLKQNLGTSKKDNVKSWRNQICTISSIDLLRPDEKVMGFDDDWKDGKVEIILHPLGNYSKKAIDSFFNITGLTREKTVVRQYEDGLTFVCATVDKGIIDKLKHYNPLRSIKPINDNLEDNFRMSPLTAKGPKLPEVISKSNIKSNPAIAIRVPNYIEAPKEISVFTPAQVETLLKEYPPGHRFYMAIVLSYHTGMRLGECLALKWEDVDLEAHSLFVRHTVIGEKDDPKFQEIPKTRSSIREIPFGKKLYKILKGERARQAARRLEYGEHYNNKGVVCCWPDGSMMIPQDFQQFNYFCKHSFGAGSFHGLRHTHATMLLEAGEDLELVSKRLGHSNIGTTSKTYSHVLDKRKAKTVALLDEIL